MQRCKTPLLAGLFLATVLLLCLLKANAQVVPDRATLNTLLGFGGTTENFESYFFATPGSAEVAFTTTLDSTTIVNGQGPGLTAGPEPLIRVNRLSLSPR